MTFARGLKTRNIIIYPVELNVFPLRLLLLLLFRHVDPLLSTRGVSGGT